MAIFKKKKDNVDYNPINEDIKKVLETKLGILNRELETIKYKCPSGYINTMDNKSINCSNNVANICVDVTVEYFKERNTSWTIFVHFKYYGVYYHPEEKIEGKSYKEKCQLIPLDEKCLDNYWFKIGNPDILKGVHESSDKVAAEVNEYIKHRYPEFKGYVSTYDSSYYSTTYITKYDKQKGKPEQYLEYFMDGLFDKVLEYNKTVEDYFAFNARRVKEYGEDFSYKHFPKMFGIDLDFSVENRIKHLQFKAEHGYFIPEDYYKLIPQDKAEEIKKTAGIKGSEKKEITKDKEEIKEKEPEETKKEIKEEIKPKPVETKKPSYSHYKKKKKFRFKKINFKKIQFNINSAILRYLIPVVVCALALLVYKQGWISNAFFSGLVKKVKFAGEYLEVANNWAKALTGWLKPAIKDFGVLWLFAMLLYLPLGLIGYVLGTIWWLISWVIVGAIKLVLFLIATIIGLIPFLLYGAGVALDILIFHKEDDKDWQIVIAFIVSLVLSLVMGMIVFF